MLLSADLIERSRSHAGREGLRMLRGGVLRFIRRRLEERIHDCF